MRSSSNVTSVGRAFLLVACARAISACGNGTRESPAAVASASATVAGQATSLLPVPSQTAVPTEARATASASAASSAPPPSGCPSTMTRVEGGKLSTLEHGRDVEIVAFCLDREEVSVARFREAVEHGDVKRGCAPGTECPSIPTSTAWFGDGQSPSQNDEDTKVSRFCNGRRKDVDGHPVNCVTFREAEDFCKARSARLPSGDEWEWAAHGKRPTPWGSPIATDEPCWGKPKKRAGTCPIGSQPKDRTDEGLVDLGGNVSEWVTPPSRAAKGPAHWAYGASWYAIDDGYARAALGGMEMPAKRAETVGFRCATDAPR